ncbi:hypothetical protein COCSUDRAFT_55096 [Coccomyxa subellipsoidea C-169]|uniref:Mediator of RNA polymerase II transcription subunit 11 n=1 Tax=Coccomyxa subellipsoidea (strain C-169) TaxID=574566 RepID=I0Z8V1_COCSC|nr:hypothetical protein COCSUDRAFT_55096 [Coccomyxa subellipsoidea C-169]EIE27070.1 hypothetical protein COCSUDRAFT_55096 [Coccomyxa subellipsoidea C-169]|eukprot:XP_005651614.1 hypothetical protein COCSUDRAFT_55096 [Coccomyxa subellipsoidea C-169]
MSSNSLSEDVNKIRGAERDIIRAVEVAAEVVKELSKLGDADQSLVEKKSKEFLGIIKEYLRSLKQDLVDRTRITAAGDQKGELSNTSVGTPAEVMEEG